MSDPHAKSMDDQQDANPDQEQRPLALEELAQLSSDAIGGRHARTSSESERLRAHLATHPDDAERHDLDLSVARAYRALGENIGQTAPPPEAGGQAYYGKLAARLRDKIPQPSSSRTYHGTARRARTLSLPSRIAHVLGGAAAAAVVFVLVRPFGIAPIENATPATRHEPIPVIPAVQDFGRPNIGRTTHLQEFNFDPARIDRLRRMFTQIDRVWQSRPSRPRGYLGIAMGLPLPPATAAEPSPVGILVHSIQAGSPAERMDLRPGDRIKAFGKQKIGASELDLYLLEGLIHQAGPGARVNLKISRSGRTVLIEGILGRAGK